MDQEITPCQISNGINTVHHHSTSLECTPTADGVWSHSQTAFHAFPDYLHTILAWEGAYVACCMRGHAFSLLKPSGGEVVEQDHVRAIEIPYIQIFQFV